MKMKSRCNLWNRDSEEDAELPSPMTLNITGNDWPLSVNPLTSTVLFPLGILSASIAIDQPNLSSAPNVPLDSSNDADIQFPPLILYSIALTEPI